MTPTEVATSVIRCQPSPTSAGERWRRPQVSRKYDQPALMAVASAVDGKPPRRLAQRARPQERIVGLVKDQQRGHDDQHALDHGREVLGLVVAELVAAVGRLGRDVDGIERDRRRDQVDDALQRVGIERDAARHPVGRVFEAQDDARHDDRGDGGKLQLVGSAGWEAERHSFSRERNAPCRWHGPPAIASLFARLAMGSDPMRASLPRSPTRARGSDPTDQARRNTTGFLRA